MLTTCEIEGISLQNKAPAGEYSFPARLQKMEKNIASWRPGVTLVSLVVLWFTMGRLGPEKEIFLGISATYLAALMFYQKIISARSEAKNLIYWWQVSFFLDLALIGALAYLTGALAPTLLLSSLLYVRVATTFHNWRAGITSVLGVWLVTLVGLGLGSQPLNNPILWVGFYLLLIHAGAMLLIGRHIKNLAGAVDRLRQEMAGLTSRLRRTSFTDQVTGLYNHHHFLTRLQSEVSRAQRQGTPVTLVLIDIDGMQKINTTYGHQIGDDVLRAIAEHLRQNFRDFDVLARYNGDTFAVSLYNAEAQKGLEAAERFRKMVAGSPKSILVDKKVTVSIGISAYPAQASNVDTLIKLANTALYQAKSYRNRTEAYISLLDDMQSRLNQAEMGLISTVKTLISVINAKDPYTYGHCERVLALAAALANKMLLPVDEIKYIQYGAFLHDFGKIEISREILNKHEPLTDKEWDQIRQHPRYGADIIKSVKSLKKIVPIILYHHERYDGSGYPNRLKGEEIPLASRILSVVDSFDAMISDRPYRKARTIPWAVQELRRCAGQQFDPQIVDTFVEVVQEKYPKEMEKVS